MKYEYFVAQLHLKPALDEPLLNDIGAMGWELVAVCCSQAYFKRQVVPTKE